MKRILILILLTVPLLAQRPPLSEYERLLIPVYAPGAIPGANGAQWMTTHWLRNDGDDAVDVFPLPRDCISSVLCFQLMRDYPSFPAHLTGINYLYAQPWRIGSGRLRGGFLFVERRGFEQFGVQLHVGDVTRDDTLTRLPVVRESEFFANARTIPGVPVSTSSRIAVRVYDLDSRPVSEVRVRVVHQLNIFHPYPPPPPVRVETTLTLTHDATTDSCGFLFGCPAGVFYQPGYGEISNLRDSLPQLAELDGRRGGAEITIEPVTEGLRYWPMITVTDNATNDVSVYTVK